MQSAEIERLKREIQKLKNRNDALEEEINKVRMLITGSSQRPQSETQTTDLFSLKFED